MNHLSKLAMLLFIILYACNNKSSEPTQDSESSAAKPETKKVQYLTPKQKSLHLFNLPDGITEQQFSSALSKMNAAISDLGYPGVGYHFYKVTSDTITEYRYFMEGLWPDPETYRIIHESKAWNQAANENTEMFEGVFANEIYRRVSKIEDM